METQTVYFTRRKKPIRRSREIALASPQQKADTARFERIVQNRGIVFGSMAEKMHAITLEEERQAGMIKGWKHASEIPSFKLVVRGRLIASHKVDFLVRLPGRRKEVHGIKRGHGTENEADRMRVKLFRALNPYINYRTFQVGGWSNRSVEYNYAQ